MKRIKLTYDEKNIKKKVVVSTKEVEDGKIEVTTRVVVTLPCRFEGRGINKELYELGFTAMPEGVRNILERHGFHYKFETGDWHKCVYGVAKHVYTGTIEGGSITDSGENDKYGYNVAIARAKAKAQKEAFVVMCGLKGVFDTAASMFEDAMKRFAESYVSEEEALERAKETGSRSLNPKN